MRRILILCCMIVLATTTAFAADDVKLGPWKKVNEKDGAIEWTRTNSRSNVDEYKATCIVKAPVPVVESILRDFSAWKKFMFMTKSTEQVIDPSLKTTADTRYILIQQTFPWPMSNRDGLLKCDFSVNKATGEVRIVCRDVDTTLKSTPGVIRMPLTDMLWVLKPVPEGTELTYQAVAVPGGDVPTAAINFLLKRIGVSTVLGVRKLIDDPKYQSKTITTQTPMQP